MKTLRPDHGFGRATISASSMPGGLDWINHELESLRARGLSRRRRVVTTLPDAWCIVAGQKLRNFAANDYLNLAHHPHLIAEATRALKAGGTGASASALITGRTEWHAALEERLAMVGDQPQAMLFPSGFGANLGTIGALAGEGDTVFCDRLNHASLVDGCRLSGARLRVYRHDRLERLAEELEKDRNSRRCLIVTDSVFSMDGDFAPLPELCDLADQFGAILIVDEAHATGVFGARGRGAVELLGVESRVSVRIGTLSKALGSLGGFVTGSAELIEFLWNRARPQMFSTALPPAACAAALAALDIVEREPERRHILAKLASTLRHMLIDAGIEPCPGGTGPIVPIIVGPSAEAVHLSQRLEERGFLVPAIRPPTVPEGTSRLRITLSCGHSTRDLEGLMAALRQEWSKESA